MKTSQMPLAFFRSSAPYRVILQLALLVFAYSLSSSAEELTYNYAGNPFNTFSGGAACPSECSISGYFTVSAPLGPNFDGYFTPDSFSFTDGLTTVTQVNSTDSAFGIITDSLSDITVWNMQFVDAQTSMYTGTGPSVLCPSDCTVTDGSFASASFAEIVNDPGSWSSATAATPEPSGFFLFGSGILAFIGLKLKKAANRNRGVLTSGHSAFLC